MNQSLITAENELKELKVRYRPVDIVFSEKALGLGFDTSTRLYGDFML
jgi:hypothetical protein